MFRLLCMVYNKKQAIDYSQSGSHAYTNAQEGDWLIETTTDTCQA